MHIAVSNDQYLNVFTATGIATTHKVRVQNTSSEPLYVIFTPSQPLPTELGEIIEPTEYSEGYLGVLWVKSYGDGDGTVQVIDLGVPSTGGEGGIAPSVTVADYFGAPIDVNVLSTTGTANVNVANTANVNVANTPAVVVTDYTGSDIQTLAPLDYSGDAPAYSVFGESITAEITDHGNPQFQYSISSYDTVTTTSGTGSVSHTQGIASVHTGTGIGSAMIKTKGSIRYVTGHLCVAEFTATYLNAETGVNSFHGPSDGSSFAAIGYEGLQFGVRITYGATTTFYPLPSLTFGAFTLDPSKTNLYRVTYAWFGIAPITFSVLTDSGWKVIYRFSKMNLGVTPHLKNPSLPVRFFVERTTGTGADIVLNSSSIRFGIIGKKPSKTLSDRDFVRFVEDRAVTANTLTPLITFRNKNTYQGLPNNVRIRYGTVNMSSDGTKDVKWFVYKNATLTGAVYSDVNTADSVAEVDTTATVITGGTLVGGALLSKVDRERINLIDGDVVISAYPNETLTLACKSQGATNVNVFLRTIEEF